MYIYIYHNFCIQSYVDGHLGGFRVLTIVNSTAVSTGVRVSFGSSFSLDICPGMGLQGHMVSFLRNPHSVLHSGCTDLHSHRQRSRFPTLHTPSSNCCLQVFFMTAILTGVKCYLIVVLICISLITKDVAHLFMEHYIVF